MQDAIQFGAGCNDNIKLNLLAHINLLLGMVQLHYVYIYMFWSIIWPFFKILHALYGLRTYIGFVWVPVIGHDDGMFSIVAENFCIIVVVMRPYLSRRA